MIVFWWGDYGDKRCLHWIKHEILCLLPCKGGLGFQHLEWYNLALLAKQAWQLIMELNSLWSKLIKGLYFPNFDFLSATNSLRTSWLWRSMIQAKNLLQRGLRKNIGDGQHTWIWEDK